MFEDFFEEIAGEEASFGFVECAAWVAVTFVKGCADEVTVLFKIEVYHGVWVISSDGVGDKVEGFSEYIDGSTLNGAARCFVLLFEGGHILDVFTAE